MSGSKQPQPGKNEERVHLYQESEQCQPCKIRAKEDKSQGMKMGHTEITVCRSLYALMQSGTKMIEGSDISIVDFQHVSPRQFLDAAKIDYIVIFSNGTSVLFQLKSQEGAKRSHLRGYPHIPCLVIGLGTKEKNAEKKLINFFGTILSGNYDAVHEIGDP